MADNAHHEGQTAPLAALSQAPDDRLERTMALTFQTMYSATSSLRQRFKRNDMFFRQQHWALLGQDSPATRAGLTPVTPVLHATIDSAHADIIDAYPEATLLGETADDMPRARLLSELIKYIQNRRHYRRVWRDWSLSLLIHGTAVQEVFWDKSIYGGLGDVNVQSFGVRNFLWNPVVEDIQESEVVFKTSFKPREWVRSHYPLKAASVPGGSGYAPSDYYPGAGRPGGEDTVLVVDMWWKEYDAGSPTPRVYMAKFANGRLLERWTDESVYGHGMYPFIVTSLVPVEGQLWGLGFVDLYGDLQSTIDRLDQIILENAELASRVKMLVNDTAQINEAELRDWAAPLVHGSRIDEGAVRWFQPSPLPAFALTQMQHKIQAMKEESGQNPVNRGQAVAGVTAASAIIALQEAGSKRSRNIVAKLYDAFAQVVDMMIRVVLENYTEERVFTVTGEGLDTMERTITRDMLLKNGRPIEFDVSVHIERQLPYRSVYNNEKMMELLSIGAIDPGTAVRMMDFERKDELMAYLKAREQEAAQ